MSGTHRRGKERLPPGVRSELKIEGFEALATSEKVSQVGENGLQDAAGGEAWSLKS